MEDRLRLADIHLNLLYLTDLGGHTVASRDPDVPTPLVHLVRTPDGNRGYVAAFLPAQARAMAEYALGGEPVVENVNALESTPPQLDALLEMLTRPESGSRLYRGPIYAFDNSPHYDGPAVLIEDVSTIAVVPELAWLKDRTPEVEGPIAVMRNEAGEVVAVCRSARSFGRDGEAGVETALAYRGRGYAAETVGLWAATVRANGGTPIYSADWSNAASRAVARKLGLVLVGEDVSLIEGQLVRPQ